MIVGQITMQEKNQILEITKPKLKNDNKTYIVIHNLSNISNIREVESYVETNIKNSGDIQVKEI